MTDSLVGLEPYLHPFLRGQHCHYAINPQSFNVATFCRHRRSWTFIVSLSETHPNQLDDTPILVVSVRFELTTPSLSEKCANQLCHETMISFLTSYSEHFNKYSFQTSYSERCGSGRSRTCISLVNSQPFYPLWHYQPIWAWCGIRTHDCTVLQTVAFDHSTNHANSQHVKEHNPCRL